MTKDIKDIAIIGGGPAGLTAGLYACRAEMATSLFEKGLPGGQVLLTETIENYPGFPDGITGMELMDRMKDQACKAGLSITQKGVTAIRENTSKEEGRLFELSLDGGATCACRSVIIATGATWRHLGVEGEDTFQGRGVSYCATCDAPLFREKDVVVVGGGDKAVEEALYLTKFARHVTLVHRRDRLRATKVLQRALEGNEKVALCLESVVTSITGDKGIEKVTVEHTVKKEKKDIPCQGVFIFIGIIPNSSLVSGMAEYDEKGYIVTDNDMRTSREGIFACGDVRKKSLWQIAVATGEGAQAAVSAEKYVTALLGTAYE